MELVVIMTLIMILQGFAFVFLIVKLFILEGRNQSI